MEDTAKRFWKVIGARVRRVRRSQGLSVDRLAQQVGIVRQQIVRLEAGIGGTTLPRLKQIADVLNVSLTDLLQDLDKTAQENAEDAERERLNWSFRTRGLSEEEIAKVIDYIRLLEKARDPDSP